MPPLPHCPECKRNATFISFKRKRTFATDLAEVHRSGGFGPERNGMAILLNAHSLDNFNMKRANRVRRSLSLLFLASLSFTAVLDAAEAPKPPSKPKLVVAIVIDQFRYDYLLRFRADYNSGLKRLLDQGAVFTDAHYLHATRSRRWDTRRF